MGKPKKALESQLDYGEQQILKKLKLEKLQEMEREILQKYHDGYKQSIMVSENSTKAKNEIYRKIKLYKAKQNNL
jgi:hypothetical protein